MKQNNEYVITNPETDEVIFKVYLYEETLEGMPQIHLETQYEVYDGPIQYVSFTNLGEIYGKSN